MVKRKKEEEQVYFDTFGGAVDAAKEYTEKRGYEIKEEDWWREIATGGKYTRARPGVGETHRFTIGLIKNGKLQKKALHIQVYGMKNKYELNYYIN